MMLTVISFGWLPPRESPRETGKCLALSDAESLILQLPAEGRRLGAASDHTKKRLFPAFQEPFEQGRGQSGAPGSSL